MDRLLTADDLKEMVNDVIKKTRKATLEEVKGIISSKNKEYQNSQMETDSSYWMGKLDCTWDLLKAIEGLEKGERNVQGI